MTKFLIEFRKPFLTVLGAKCFFFQINSAISSGFLRPWQIFKQTNDPIPRKRPNRVKDVQSPTDRPYFIEPSTRCRVSRNHISQFCRHFPRKFIRQNNQLPSLMRENLAITTSKEIKEATFHLSLMTKTKSSL